MKTLSNNYRNESYWSGKVAHKLCASGYRIWLQWWSIQRGRSKGVHLLWPFLSCGSRNDVPVIVIYWKWSHRLHIDACTAMDTKCTVRNSKDVISDKSREWLSVGNLSPSFCVKKWAQERYWNRYKLQIRFPFLFWQKQPQRVAKLGSAQGTDVII